ncbi:TetR/AcrR family transcriptional regulator [Bacillus andreraoultii]|uniref:TetR/AcrR family transcriptional regulator n=1 Tax=Bacillus andreraoultii TaxID=1499685 RepID=UPI001E4BD3C9|nr:TetR/AcrR family transcriptional regulator [Bacillus andreraoultii]
MIILTIKGSGDSMNKRKRKVADIALKLFIEKGIQQTSIQDIIDHANISKGTFYNYFTSKNDCIAEILEGLRYDASQIRMEMQVGKDEKNRQILIEQISVLINLNEKNKLSALFEAILNSNETELRKLVLHHRIYELEWLSNRFIEVYGDEIRNYAFELSILFFGMIQHMLFALKITNTSYSINQLVEIIITYLEKIKGEMVEKKFTLLDPESLSYIRTKINRKVLSKAELLTMAKDIETKASFTNEQRDLFHAICEELNQKRTRTAVLQSLIKPFQHSFSMTELEQQVRMFCNSVWYFLRMEG